MSVLERGQHERLKATIHAALGGLALLCTAYNVLAWRRRRELHLARNVGMYGALALLEASQVSHHLAARR